MVVPANAAAGLMVVTAGSITTTALPGQEAVTPPAVTLTAPLEALVGTVTVSDVEVADTTVAVTPPIVTRSPEAVELKPWPRMVIVEPVDMVAGFTLKTA